MLTRSGLPELGASRRECWHHEPSIVVAKATGGSVDNTPYQSLTLLVVDTLKMCAKSSFYLEELSHVERQ